MAIIDDKPRSAAAFSRLPVICYLLSKEDLTNIKNQDAQLAIKILSGITRELSARMRRLHTMNIFSDS